ncbi:serine hydrolase domain-containing protein [Isoptericola jiangsuensis]|uniref:serine hydrolase domain-containing protein n=1 Tax=Isoptericola jiangsuensis TaxID=548579 RepID=UPI003AB08258
MTTTRLLPRATPESQGVDPAALTRLVEVLDEIHDVHSLMVLRHGRVVAEAWWDPFTADEPHRMYSVSKSVTATAVGIAVGEGLLTVDDRVVDLLPDDAPEHPDAHLAAMTVRDLLTMTSGHATDTMSFTLHNLHRPGSSWARDILAAPVTYEPGTRFVYDTGATYLVAAILHRLTGQRLLDYLTPRLFAPLGITGATWEQCPRGIDVGGYGLTLTTEQLATLGQLWSQRGRWGDDQLVDASWVDEMTSAQVPNGPDENVDWNQGYGYQFWRCRFGAFRADGAFGQFAVVRPDLDLVVVLTSGTTRTAEELEAVLELLGPACTDVPSSAPGAPSSVPDGGAPFTLDELAVAVPGGSASTLVGAMVEGSEFLLQHHDGAAVDEGGHGRAFLRWHSVAVRHDADVIELSWTTGAHGSPRTVRCGAGHWVRGSVELDGEPLPVAAAAAWTAHDTLVARMVWQGTPFALDVTLQFGGDGEGRHVEVAVDQNVAFGPTALLRATGLGV